MTEYEIKKIIKDVIKSEIEKIEKKLKSVKDDSSEIKKSQMDEEMVKKIVRKMIINQYKWMWEKSSTYINRL